MGSYHKELETELKRYLKVPYVSLMVNGHMALEMTLQAMGFLEGSEVITTPFTFVSTTHAIIRNRLHPVFCDIKSTFIGHCSTYLSRILWVSGRLHADKSPWGFGNVLCIPRISDQNHWVFNSVETSFIPTDIIFQAVNGRKVDIGTYLS